MLKSLALNNIQMVYFQSDMRKFLATIALFIIMIGTLAPVSFSLTTNSNTNKSVKLTIEPQKALAAIPSGGCPSGTVPNATATDCIDPEDSDGESFCATFDVGCWIAVGLVQYVLLPIPSFVAGLFGITSDLFLKFSISSSVYGTCPASGCDQIATAIREAWGIVRDFANIGFIFALFVAAFMLILDKTSVGGKQFEPKQVVVRVIIMALLVNFSLFFCRMIIQTADIFSNLLYNRMDATASGNSSAGLLGSALSAAKVKSPSLALLVKVNPQNLLTNTEIKAAGGTSVYVVISVISFFLYFVFIFMFAQMIFIFAGRIFGLWVAMILSPFAFVSYAIPFLEDNQYIGFDNWFKSFVKLAFTTPIFLFFLYLTISILKIEDLGSATFTQLASLKTNSNWMVSVAFMAIEKLVPLLAGVFMLMYGKKMAIEMSGVVGEMAGKISGAVTGVAMGAVTGGMAFAGRQTVGALGSKLAEKTADKPGLSGLNTLGKGLSTSTFDVRNSKVFSKGLGYAGSATGQQMDIGMNNLQEKGGHAATGGVGQILADRKERIADAKATAAEKEAEERANNPQSIENVKKRNAERALKQTQAAKAAEEAKIAAEAEKETVDTDAQEIKLAEENTKIDETISENNAKIADIDRNLAGKDIPSDEDVAKATKDKKEAEAEKTTLDADEVALATKIAANAAAMVAHSEKDYGSDSSGKGAQEEARIAQEKVNLDAEKLRLDAKKATNQQKIDNATAVTDVKEMASEKAKLEASNVKKEEEKAVNNSKLKALDNIKGKTVAQVRDEAEIAKAEAEGSDEKAALDKATKDADEEAKKVAELQEKIKKAEKEKDTKLVEELKKELNGDNWEEIDAEEEKMKKGTKEQKAAARKRITELVGGKQEKLNKVRGKAIEEKAAYENKYGKTIRALEDIAKDTEKAYKGKQENKDRVAVFTKRENEQKVDLVRATIEVNNMRKKILGAHADSLASTGQKVDGHPMYSVPVNAGKAVIGAVAPILGVITNGRVGGGYVNNANITASTAIRNTVRTTGVPDKKPAAPAPDKK